MGLVVERVRLQQHVTCKAYEPAQSRNRQQHGSLSRTHACRVACVAQKVTKPKLSYVGASVEGICPDKTSWGLVGPAVPLAPRISRTDADFLAVGVEFLDDPSGLKIGELNELFEKVGFPRRDPERLKVALANTHKLIWIRAIKQSRFARMGQLLGFARATSDGSISATIWDVAVNPAWQRVGLGRAMMERLTKRLVEDDIRIITLYAEPNVVGLYEKLGFVKDPEGIRGMAFQRKRTDKA